ncbi:hypothetical protein RJ640_007084 [Escallonia rubra]|uniref:DUF547 domain-containing protein n=1 Tax=Escallonia rubra TaxID=112253 RepID=A0AA88RD92_9ASTE|nr:hypothetical protein RJ640_007084 [Escallonia rubra]
MAHQRYITLVQDLHRVNIFVLSANEKLAFFLNLYNAMVIHAVIMVGHPGGGLTFSKVNSLIHFGLCNGTRSSPTVRFFSPQGVESELRYAAREFFQKDGMEVDLAKRTVYLTRIIKWYNVDFGQDKEILQWLIKSLDASKADFDSLIRSLPELLLLLEESPVPMDVGGSITLE